MFEIASKIVFCLLLAALLGFIIGYLFCRMKHCKNNSKKSDETQKYYPKESSTLYQSSNENNVDSKNDAKNSILEQKGSKEETNVATYEKIDGAKPKTVNKEDVNADDLKKIKGIGTKIETSLNALGIYTFEQISNWSQDEINWVDSYLTFKGRIEREDWIEQAKILASGKETTFSKKYK